MTRRSSRHKHRTVEEDAELGMHGVRLGDGRGDGVYNSFGNGQGCGEENGPGGSGYGHGDRGGWRDGDGSSDTVLPRFYLDPED